MHKIRDVDIFIGCFEGYSVVQNVIFMHKIYWRY
jgi:hypothetical protein